MWPQGVVLGKTAMVMAMRPSSPVSLHEYGHAGTSEMSFKSPRPHRTVDKAGYSTRSPSTVPGSVSTYMHTPVHSPSQRTVPAVGSLYIYYAVSRSLL